MNKITLKAARVNKGLTQTEASHLLGVHINTLLNWEKGKFNPSQEMLIKMSELYQIPLKKIKI